MLYYYVIVTDIASHSSVLWEVGGGYDWWMGHTVPCQDMFCTEPVELPNKQKNERNEINQPWLKPKADN